MTDSRDTREAVRQRYAAEALRVLRQEPTAASCCCGASSALSETDASACGGSSADPVTGNRYSSAELAAIPTDAATASLGCVNPAALIDLRPGDVVLDLGSGGGIDVLLSARRVGPTGRAYGLDMTDEMVGLARRNAEQAGATNIQFLRGQIEDIPLADASVDVVISNCVINLSTDKDRVLREAFRVLRPGGRFAVSDVVVDEPVSSDLRRRVELWVGCVSGALDRQEYLARLQAACFEAVSIVPTRTYSPDDIDDGTLSAEIGTQPEAERTHFLNAFFSAFVRARKPLA